MRIPRIFQNQPLQVNDELALPLDSSHRLTIVLRLKEGHPLILFNGDGYEYTSIIHHLKSNRVYIKILEKKQKNVESPLKIHLGQGLTKGEKMDLIIQKATELGVHKITPLFSERSMVHLNPERLEKKAQHFQKIAIQAAEQCGRTVIPILEKPSLLIEWIANRQENTRFILEPTASHDLADTEIVGSLALLIGPEGGLTKEESNIALQHGFTSLRLGPRILRTETAAIVAITAMQCKAGDL